MQKGRRRWRTWLHAGHKWAGLSLGALFVLLGLTGSLLVFYQELDDGFRDSGSAPVLAVSPDRIVAALRVAEPERGGPWRIELPDRAKAPITARYLNPTETAGRGFAPLILRLDPESLAVRERYFWGENVWTWIYKLHYTLLLGPAGSIVLGIAGLLTLLLLGTGLILWWPAAGQWPGALAIKRSAVWKRRVYDLHVKPGVYVVALSLVVVLTGTMMAVPDWFKPGIGWFSLFTAVGGPGQRPPMSGAPVLTAEVAMATAGAHFPTAHVRWIETPGGDQPYWRVQMRQEGEPNRRFPRSQVWIDAVSGDLIAVRDPRRNSAGDSIFDWLHPLHNGEALGLAGRIAIFLLGFAPLLAFVTGWIRWQHKRAAARSVPAR